jgi:hypothetical protein
MSNQNRLFEYSKLVLITQISYNQLIIINFDYSMTTQMNNEETLKKDFINIFEISHLFDVSGITARRYINGIFKEIELMQEKLKLADQADQAMTTQKLKTLSDRVRRKVVGQTKAGEDIFILELAKKEALEKWPLRPTVKTASQETPDQAEQATVKETVQMPDQLSNQMSNQNLVTDIYGQKYISLLETQLTEKDNTIKDLRETNKFLSITNGKLNEQLRMLLEKPQGPNNPTENINRGE